MLSSAQIWTIIGRVFGLFAAMLTITVAGITSQQRGIRSEFVSGFSGLRGEFAERDLARDIQAVSARVLRGPETT